VSIASSQKAREWARRYARHPAEIEKRQIVPWMGRDHSTLGLVVIVRLFMRAASVVIAMGGIIADLPLLGQFSSARMEWTHWVDGGFPTADTRGHEANA
jgi:hypothetical protein